MPELKHIPEALLRKAYLEEKLSIKQIAKKYKYHPSLVYTKLHLYKIPMRVGVPWNKNKTKKECPDLKWGGNFDSRIPWNKGLTKEVDKRVQKQAETYSKTHKDMSGSKNPFFNKRHTEEFRKEQSLRKGGTGIPGETKGYGPEFDNVLKEQIRFRDHYKCRECGCPQIENGRCLDVHHIDYNKFNNVFSNLVALCRICHTATGTNREYWQKHFSNLITT